MDILLRYINRLAVRRGEYAGAAIPMKGHTMIVANDRLLLSRLTQILNRKRPDPEDRWTVKNRWQRTTAYATVIWEKDGVRETTVSNFWTERLGLLSASISARRAVLPEAELNAMTRLFDYLDVDAKRDYILSGVIPEIGRSGTTYFLRKGLPTLAFLPNRGDVDHRTAVVLCTHPLGYYTATHTGLMPPSDEVLAHLLMIRADEHYFWRKANQLPITDPRAAV